MGDCLNFVSYYNDDDFYYCTFSLFFFNRINGNIIKIQSLLFPKQIEQPYDKETGIRKNNGLFIFRSSVIRIISISLLLITARRNEQKCQVIPSTLKFLKQPSKSVFSPRKLYYPMVINSNVNIRRKISNYRLPKIFHRIRHRSEEKGILIFRTIFLSRLAPQNVNPRHKRISIHFVSVQ